ncbi:MAG: hypothetical protein IH588_01960 [Anaerolineales bacterium]|nr:hypothetical protein [Anaerolineales bacterium]
MNNFQTDDLLNMAKEKNQEDVDSQLFLKATQLNGTRWLAALGAWMVAKGEKIQARYTTSLRPNRLGLPLNKIKKARAH